MGGRIRRYERVIGLVQHPNHSWTVTSRKKDGRATIHDCRVVLTEREPDGDFSATDHYGVLAVVQVVPNPA